VARSQTSISAPGRQDDSLWLRASQIDLEAEYKGKIGALYEKWRQIDEDHGEVLLTPRKVDVQVTLFALAWTPLGA
jgi:hypothetical protein